MRKMLFLVVTLFAVSCSMEGIFKYWGDKISSSETFVAELNKYEGHDEPFEK